MSIGKDRKTQLIDLYIVNDKDLLFISMELNYADPKSVANDLKKYNIPLRENDEAKTHYDLKKQYDNKTSLTGHRYISNATTIFTERIDIRNYSRAQIFLDISDISAPATKQVDISFEVSFRSDQESWFKINDSAISSIKILQTVMPAKFGYTIDLLGGEFFRVKLSTSGGGNLTSSAYILINSVKGSFV